MVGASSSSDVEVLNDTTLSSYAASLYMVSATDVSHEVVRTQATATHWTPTRGNLQLDEGLEGEDLPPACQESLGK